MAKMKRSELEFLAAAGVSGSKAFFGLNGREMKLKEVNALKKKYLNDMPLEELREMRFNPTSVIAKFYWLAWNGKDPENSGRYTMIGVAAENPSRYNDMM